MDDSTYGDLKRMCDSIVETLNDFNDGKVYDCETGAMVDKDELEEAWIKEHEDEEFELDEERYEDLYTWLSDNYGVKIITDITGEDLFGAEICVAWGGPNIYIETRDAYVRGYWGSTTVEVPFSYSVCDKINDIINDWKECY